MSRLQLFDRFDVDLWYSYRLLRTAHDHIPLWFVISPPPPRCYEVYWRRSIKRTHTYTHKIYIIYKTTTPSVFRFVIVTYKILFVEP